LANPNVIKMTLPKSKTNEKTNKQLITLSVTEDKKFYIDKEEVPFESLESTLISMIDKSKEQTVVVRIPFNLQVQDLVDVLQIGIKNNLKFVIATSPK
jgi:biopolymer transport protein ExbD